MTPEETRKYNDVSTRIRAAEKRRSRNRTRARLNWFEGRNGRLFPKPTKRVTITRARFMRILEHNLSESGTQLTVRRFNSFLTDMGFTLDP